ncbi:hypothetical protein EMGBD2_02420 [Nitrospirota bacterium]|nr:hypothetical protein EMGBD2_02420 [Nitrospirota bacterium]
MTASLINRLGIAPYQLESRGLVRYWGNDGEGTEGIVELVYQDHTSRIYYLEGSHHSRLLPDIAGKAVVLLRMNQVTDSNGTAAMESTFVYYTRLDNRLLSGLLSLFRPLVGSTVTKKMVKGVDSVNRLSLAMQQQPARILSEAASLLPSLSTRWLFCNRRSSIGLIPSAQFRRRRWRHDDLTQFHLALHRRRLLLYQLQHGPDAGAGLVCRVAGGES